MINFHNKTKQITEPRLGYLHQSNYVVIINKTSPDPVRNKS